MTTLGMKSQTVGLSVVAPCFNEVEGLEEFCRRTTAACAGLMGNDYEIVLVNDGSRDGTWPLMLDLLSRDPQLVAINLSRNFGHQLALSAGLRHASGEKILIIDADLQDPPELLPAMLATMESEQADVVYGQRRLRAGETASKKLTAKVFYRLLRGLTNIDIPADTGDFRLMSRRALDVLNAMPEHHRFIRGMVSWIGFRQIPFAYDRDARFAGETKYPLSKMLRFALDAVTGFSIAPLRFASGLGIVFGLIALGMLIYTFASWVSGRTVAGWSSLATIVLVLGSVQLFIFGVMGEYLGRLYLEVKGRPLYIIGSVVRGKPLDHLASARRDEKALPRSLVERDPDSSAGIPMV